MRRMRHVSYRSTSTATITVSDEGVPVAVDDAAATTEEQSVDIDLTANDIMAYGATSFRAI